MFTTLLKKSCPAILLWLLCNAIPATGQSYKMGLYNAHDARAYYFSTNQDYYLPFFARELGPDFAQTVKYSYKINNGAPVRQVATVDHNHASNCVNAVNLSIYRIALSTPLRFNQPGSYVVKVWIDSINGQPNLPGALDTLERHIKALDQVPPRMGLTEYGYHAYCGPCGDVGSPFFIRLLTELGEYTVPIKLHNSYGGGPGNESDLDCPEAIAIDNAINGNAHPNMMYNRAYINPYVGDNQFYPYDGFCPLDPNIFMIKDIAFSNKVPVALSVAGLTMSNTSNALSFTLKATFTDAMVFDKELRLSCILVEDSIYHYQASENPGNEYHRFVMRKVYGGAWGQPNSVPASVGQNQTVSISFSDVLDTAYNKSKLYLIPVLQQYGADATLDREVLNVRRFKVSDLLNTTGLEEHEAPQGLLIYPNPATDKVLISCRDGHRIGDVRVYTMDGRRCSQVKAAGSMHAGPLEVSTARLPPGVYIIGVSDENGFRHMSRLSIVR